ncbi:MAG: acyl carrier protein [Chloroflexi bacterium]|nr:acyl carrier protein [Chloroflexota bacterium]
MSTTFERVQKIIVDRLQVKPEEVVPTAKLREDLKVDSLYLVELLNDLEDEFGFTISEDETKDVVTVADVVNLAEKKLG